MTNPFASRLALDLDSILAGQVNKTMMVGITEEMCRNMWVCLDEVI